MSFSYKREEIAEGIGFNCITDEKFKTDSVRIKFITPLDENSVGANALALTCIASTNSVYKTQNELSSKLASLYGAGIYADTGKRADSQILTIGFSCINNRYALENEDIFGQTADIFLDCLFSPNIEEGGFEKSNFAVRKADLIDNIISEINNKRSYAIQRANQTIYKNEPSAINPSGTRESVEALTPQSVYAALLKLFETSVIEIYYTGPSLPEGLKEKMSSAFKNNIPERNTVKPVLRKISCIKSTPENVSETMDLNQSKLVMAFKTECKDKYAIKMMNMIFGGTPFSKLFSNVREKLSLCYYCASNFNDGTGVLLVDSGVEDANVEKARNEIIAQLEDIRNGLFSDEDIENSRLYILNTLKAIGDTPASYASWYFLNFCNQTNLSPKQTAEKYMNVTKQQIIDAAKAFSLDTIYVVSGSETNK